jgi:V8-like Glu-specific endopeptidase
MRWLLGLVLGLTLGISPAVAGMTAKEAAEKLEQSVVAVTYKGDTICTAAKIGPGQFLTALHCLAKGEKLVMPNGRILKIRSALVGFEGKPMTHGVSGRDEDWAILNTTDDDQYVPALELACTEEAYLGQAVAYMGFPWPTQLMFGLGHVTTVAPMDVNGPNMDIGTDVPAAPGASGSPVISMDTGKILGVLTEGIRGAHREVFVVGIESVKNMDACAGAGVAAVAALKAPSADALEK